MQDLFKAAEASEFLEPFVDMTGCEELEDLLNSADEDIEEWMSELEMEPEPIKRILRYIQKYRETGNDDASAGTSVSTLSSSSTLMDTSSSNSSSAAALSSVAESVPESIHPLASPLAASTAAAEAALDDCGGTNGGSSSSSSSLIPPAPRGVPQSPLPPRFSAFLSHFKVECGTEARLLQQGLEAALEAKQATHVDAFIDSDNLRNLRNLLDHVRESECVILLQSKGVLTRPWCLLELYTAATCGVPILCLNVQGPFPYDFLDAKDFLTHLDTRLEAANPGAPQQLEEYGVDLTDCAYVLSNCLPNTISLPFDPRGTRNMIKASVLDLADNMLTAATFNPLFTKAEWMARRHKCDDDSSSGAAAAEGKQRRGEGDRGEVGPPAAAVLAPVASSSSAGGSEGSGKSPNACSAVSSASGGSHSSSSHDNSRVRRGEWRLGEKIGQGAFGMVYKGMNTANGEIVAIKELNFDASKKRQLKEMVKEVDLMRRLRHPNIVKYLGGQEELEQGRLYIFTEFVAGGSVGALVKTYGAFKEAVVRRYASECLEGLVYLHAHKILHRDIKPDNVLINQSGVAKLADFGASAFKPGSGRGGGDEDEADGCEATASDQSSTLAGTPYFMSPEAVAQKGAGQRSDVWSFGGFVLNMVSGQAPWRCLKLKGQYQLFTTIESNKRESPLDVEERVARKGEPLVTADLRDFLQLCFERNYDKRPYASSLQQHPFLRDPLLADDESNGEGAGDDDAELGQTTAGIEGLLLQKEAKEAKEAECEVAQQRKKDSPPPTSPPPPSSSEDFGSAKKKNPFGGKKKAGGSGTPPKKVACDTPALVPFGAGDGNFDGSASEGDQVNVASVVKQATAAADSTPNSSHAPPAAPAVAAAAIRPAPLPPAPPPPEEEEEEEVVVVMVGIDSAWEQGVISPTQYQALSRMNIFEIDPKNLPAAISEKGGNGLGGGRRR